MSKALLRLILSSLIVLFLTSPLRSAQLFDDVGKDTIGYTTTPITAYPFTACAWFRSNDTANERVIWSINIGTSDTANGWNLTADGEFSDVVRFRVFKANSGTQVGAGASFTINVWGHVCGVGASATSRTVYFNGGNSAESTTNKTPDGTITNVDIGIQRNDVGGDIRPFSGDIAEVSMWNAALTATEVAILAAGWSARFIRPASLVFYAPIIRATDDVVGGLVGTSDGNTVSIHPLMIYPSTPFIVGMAGVAAAATRRPIGPIIFQ